VRSEIRKNPAAKSAPLLRSKHAGVHSRRQLSRSADLHGAMIGTDA
jgi:hypothetical protein